MTGLEYYWDLVLGNFVGVLIVFFRVTGIFTFNPIFGRQNVPMQVRVMMSIVLAVTMLTTMGGNTGFMPTSMVNFVLMLIFEGLIGMMFGFFVNMILTVMIYAGEQIDNQTGLSMAASMDPSTGIQMPVFANLYYYLFILYFFLSGSHREYIRLFALSYDIIPIGFMPTINTYMLLHNVTMFFGTIFVLAVKLALPIIATELIVEFCIGVMMKAVPSIQVFVVNIQLKILIGLFVLFAVAQPMSDFLDSLLGIMWKNLSVIMNGFI